METILAIETSVPNASVALWRDGEIVFKKNFASDRNHNSMVFNPMARILNILGEGKLSLLLVGSGPGSYSGIRIGIAVAQGIAIAHDCPVAGLGSLAATPEARGNKPPLPAPLGVGDARRGLYFISPVTADGEAAEPELMDAATFAARLGQASNHPLLTFDDPACLGLEAALEQRVTRTKPEARFLIDIWLGSDESRRQKLIRQPLAPSYLRAPFTSKAKTGHPLLRKK